MDDVNRWREMITTLVEGPFNGIIRKQRIQYQYFRVYYTVALAIIRVHVYYAYCVS